MSDSIQCFDERADNKTSLEDEVKHTNTSLLADMAELLTETSPMFGDGSKSALGSEEVEKENETSSTVGLEKYATLEEMNNADIYQSEKLPQTFQTPECEVLAAGALENVIPKKEQSNINAEEHCEMQYSVSESQGLQLQEKVVSSISRCSQPSKDLMAAKPKVTTDLKEKKIGGKDLKKRKRDEGSAAKSKTAENVGRGDEITQKMELSEFHFYKKEGEKECTKLSVVSPEKYRSSGEVRRVEEIILHEDSFKILETADKEDTCPKPGKASATSASDECAVSSKIEDGVCVKSTDETYTYLNILDCTESSVASSKQQEFVVTKHSTEMLGNCNSNHQFDIGVTLLHLSNEQNETSLEPKSNEMKAIVSAENLQTSDYSAALRELNKSDVQSTECENEDDSKLQVNGNNENKSPLKMCEIVLENTLQPQSCEAIDSLDSPTNENFSRYETREIRNEVFSSEEKLSDGKSKEPIEFQEKETSQNSEAMTSLGNVERGSPEHECLKATTQSQEMEFFKEKISFEHSDENNEEEMQAVDIEQRSSDTDECKTGITGVCLPERKDILLNVTSAVIRSEECPISKETKTNNMPIKNISEADNESKYMTPKNDHGVVQVKTEYGTDGTEKSNTEYPERVAESHKGEEALSESERVIEMKNGDGERSSQYGSLNAPNSPISLAFGNSPAKKSKWHRSKYEGRAKTARMMLTGSRDLKHMQFSEHRNRKQNPSKHENVEATAEVNAHSEATYESKKITTEGHQIQLPRSSLDAVEKMDISEDDQAKKCWSTPSDNGKKMTSRTRYRSRRKRSERRAAERIRFQVEETTVVGNAGTEECVVINVPTVELPIFCREDCSYPTERKTRSECANMAEETYNQEKELLSTIKSDDKQNLMVEQKETRSAETLEWMCNTDGQKELAQTSEARASRELSTDGMATSPLKCTGDLICGESKNVQESVFCSHEDSQKTKSHKTRQRKKSKHNLERRKLKKIQKNLAGSVQGKSSSGGDSGIKQGLSSQLLEDDTGPTVKAEQLPEFIEEMESQETPTFHESQADMTKSCGNIRIEEISDLGNVTGVNERCQAVLESSLLEFNDMGDDPTISESEACRENQKEFSTPWGDVKHHITFHKQSFILEQEEKTENSSDNEVRCWSNSIQSRAMQSTETGISLEPETPSSRASQFHIISDLTLGDFQMKGASPKETKGKNRKARKTRSKGLKLTDQKATEYVEFKEHEIFPPNPETSKFMGNDDPECCGGQHSGLQSPETVSPLKMKYMTSKNDQDLVKVRTEYQTDCTEKSDSENVQAPHCRGHVTTFSGVTDSKKSLINDIKSSGVSTSNLGNKLGKHEDSSTKDNFLVSEENQLVLEHKSKGETDSCDSYEQMQVLPMPTAFSATEESKCRKILDSKELFPEDPYLSEDEMKLYGYGSYQCLDDTVMTSSDTMQNITANHDVNSPVFSSQSNAAELPVLSSFDDSKTERFFISDHKSEEITKSEDVSKKCGESKEKNVGSLCFKEEDGILLNDGYKQSALHFEQHEEEQQTDSESDIQIIEIGQFNQSHDVQESHREKKDSQESKVRSYSETLEISCLGYVLRNKSPAADYSVPRKVKPETLYMQDGDETYCNNEGERHSSNLACSETAQLPVKKINYSGNHNRQEDQASVCDNSGQLVIVGSSAVVEKQSPHDQQPGISETRSRLQVGKDFSSNTFPAVENVASKPKSQYRCQTQNTPTCTSNKATLDSYKDAQPTEYLVHQKDPPKIFSCKKSEEKQVETPEGKEKTESVALPRVADLEKFLLLCAERYVAYWKGLHSEHDKDQDSDSDVQFLESAPPQERVENEAKDQKSNATEELVDSADKLEDSQKLPVLNTTGNIDTVKILEGDPLELTLAECAADLEIEQPGDFSETSENSITMKNASGTQGSTIKESNKYSITEETVHLCKDEGQTKSDVTQTEAHTTKDEKCSLSNEQFDSEFNANEIVEDLSWEEKLLLDEEWPKELTEDSTKQIEMPKLHVRSKVDDFKLIRSAENEAAKLGKKLGCEPRLDLNESNSSPNSSSQKADGIPVGKIRLKRGSAEAGGELDKTQKLEARFETLLRTATYQTFSKLGSSRFHFTAVQRSGLANLASGSGTNYDPYRYLRTPDQNKNPTEELNSSQPQVWVEHDQDKNSLPSEKAKEAFGDGMKEKHQEMPQHASKNGECQNRSKTTNEIKSEQLNKKLHEFESEMTETKSLSPPHKKARLSEKSFVDVHRTFQHIGDGLKVKIKNSEVKASSMENHSEYEENLCRTSRYNELATSVHSHQQNSEQQSIELQEEPISSVEGNVTLECLHELYRESEDYSDLLQQTTDESKPQRKIENSFEDMASDDDTKCNLQNNDLKQGEFTICSQGEVEEYSGEEEGEIISETENDDRDFSHTENNVVSARKGTTIRLKGAGPDSSNKTAEKTNALNARFSSLLRSASISCSAPKYPAVSAHANNQYINKPGQQQQNFFQLGNSVDDPSHCEVKTIDTVIGVNANAKFKKWRKPYSGTSEHQWKHTRMRGNSFNDVAKQSEEPSYFFTDHDHRRRVSNMQMEAIEEPARQSLDRGFPLNFTLSSCYQTDLTDGVDYKNQNQLTEKSQFNSFDTPKFEKTSHHSGVKTPYFKYQSFDHETSKGKSREKGFKRLEERHNSQSLVQRQLKEISRVIESREQRVRSPSKLPPQKGEQCNSSLGEMFKMLSEVQTLLTENPVEISNFHKKTNENNMSSFTEGHSLKASPDIKKRKYFKGPKVNPPLENTSKRKLQNYHEGSPVAGSSKAKYTKYSPRNEDFNFKVKKCHNQKYFPAKENNSHHLHQRKEVPSKPTQFFCQPYGSVDDKFNKKNTPSPNINEEFLSRHREAAINVKKENHQGSSTFLFVSRKSSTSERLPGEHPKLVPDDKPTKYFPEEKVKFMSSAKRFEERDFQGNKKNSSQKRKRDSLPDYNMEKKLNQNKPLPSTSKSQKHRGKMNDEERSNLSERQSMSTVKSPGNKISSKKKEKKKSKNTGEQKDALSLLKNYFTAAKDEEETASEMEEPDVAELHIVLKTPKGSTNTAEISNQEALKKIASEGKLVISSSALKLALKKSQNTSLTKLTLDEPKEKCDQQTWKFSESDKEAQRSSCSPELSTKKKYSCKQEPKVKEALNDPPLTRKEVVPLQNSAPPSNPTCQEGSSFSIGQSQNAGIKATNTDDPSSLLKNYFGTFNV